MRGVNQPPLASIVICVRDDLRIERCLDAIFGDGALGFDDPFEVIVIENHDHPTLGWLVDRFPIIYGVEPSIGMHRARQKGVELARGEFVVCTDADCIPQRGWLAEIVRPLEADPDVQVVGGGIEKVEPASWVELLQPDLGGAHAEPQFLPRISPLPFAVTANATFRRTQLLEVGGFDGDFRSGGDVDLSWRILSRGGSLVLAGPARVSPDPAIVLPSVPDLQLRSRTALQQAQAAECPVLLRPLPSTPRNWRTPSARINRSRRF